TRLGARAPCGQRVRGLQGETWVTSSWLNPLREKSLLKFRGGSPPPNSVDLFRPSLDLMVEQTPENATRLFQAFSDLSLTPEFSKELVSSPSERPQQLALKMGYYADLVTTGREVEFETEWNMASEARLGPSQVRVASRDLLIRQKQKAAREKDLKDVELLERGA
ncbi:MAG: hypothetical protein AB7P37_04445, partial [Ramlibacter sp.]